MRLYLRYGDHHRYFSFCAFIFVEISKTETAIVEDYGEVKRSIKLRYDVFAVPVAASIELDGAFQTVSDELQKINNRFSMSCRKKRRRLHDNDKKRGSCAKEQAI